MPDVHAARNRVILAVNDPSTWTCDDDSALVVLANLSERVNILEVRQETAAKIAALEKAHKDTAKSKLRFGPPEEQQEDPTTSFDATGDVVPERCPNCGFRLRGNADA